MISDAAIKSALKSVQTELVLTDKSAGRGSGSLMIVVRRLSDGSTSAQWFAKVKRDGKRTKKALGRYPEMSLAMARQFMATEVSPALVAGKPMRVALVGDKPTVERMFQGYAAAMKAAGKVSASEVERVLLLTKTHCAADELGRDRMAGDIDPQDVADYVAKFYQEGSKGAADKARSYVSSAFNWARKSMNDYKNPHRRDWGVKGNPADDVPRDPDASNTCDRNLSAQEVRAVWMGATADSYGFSLETAAVVRIMLGCGQRVEETLRIDGAEIDLVAGTWNMPKAKTKMKMRPHSIPIPRQLLPILAELKAVHGDGPLFASRVDSKMERITPRGVRQSINRWHAAAKPGFERFTPRDLRRTWKSRTGEIGMPREMRDVIQQHAKGDTGSVHYDRADYLPQMRKAMALWEGWLDQVLAPEGLQLKDAA